MHLPQLHSGCNHILSASISPPGSGPHCACWPWWLEDPSHPLFCLFCNKMGCFSLLLQKFTQDPPLRIVAFPCIDVWLVVHIHLLFYALDFKENERGPIMLIGSCSVKRNQGLPHSSLTKYLLASKVLFQMQRDTYCSVSWQGCLLESRFCRSTN